MGADLKMAGDGSLCVHSENIHSLASLFSLCYSTHKSSILRGRESTAMDILLTFFFNWWEKRMRAKGF